MIISIGFVVVITFILLAIGVLSFCFGMDEGKVPPVIVGIVFILISMFLTHQMYRNIPKIEDPAKESFYKIQKVEFEDGTFKQISLIKKGKAIDITNLGEPQIYPENSILRRYGYKSKSGWIKFHNKNSFYYEIIMPNSEKYEKAKEKVTKIKISNNNSDNLPELEKEELYDCYINREEEKL